MEDVCLTLINKILGNQIYHYPLSARRSSSEAGSLGNEFPHKSDSDHIQLVYMLGILLVPNYQPNYYIHRM
jgi:hypothetical protein